MVKNKKFKKKGVFNYENYFEPFVGWKAPKQEVSKHVLYRWAKSRVKYFKKDQKRKKRKNFRTRLKKSSFFLTYFKIHILVFLYVAVPLSILLVLFNWFIFIKPINTMAYVEYWNKMVFQYGYAFSYRDFVVFLHYNFSPMVITIKILLFPPLFISHLFVIWYVHINTKWNDYMERKMISIVVWRLGVGYLPASAEIINSWIFWGERYYYDFYKNTLVTGPFFVVKQIWKFFGTILNTGFKTSMTFILNFFK